MGIVISQLLDPQLIHNALAYADMALKTSKSKEIEYVIFDDTMNKSKEFKNDLEWSIRLREAIKRDMYVPYFQPIGRNSDRKITKYECLIRLVDDGEVIGPYMFISIAKKIKVYSRLTRMMIGKCFDTFKGTNYEFSINVSAFDIYDKETLARIMSTLDDFSCTLSKNLVFEIIESEGIENYDLVKKFIEDGRSSRSLGPGSAFR
jgi:EAL domain-containing protein (putative c-di-GMP-specific phosphodiesterase class I)